MGAGLVRSWRVQIMAVCRGASLSGSAKRGLAKRVAPPVDPSAHASYVSHAASAKTNTQTVASLSLFLFAL